MIQFFGIHIGTLYFPTSILLITLLVLVGFIIYFLSRRKRNRDQTIQSNENRVKGKRGKEEKRKRQNSVNNLKEELIYFVIKKNSRLK
jgi:hypothetical protein